MLPLQIFKRYSHCIGCGNSLLLPLSRTKNFNINSNVAGTQRKDNQLLERINRQMSTEQLDALGWNQVEIEGNSMNKHEFQNEIKIANAKRATKSAICKPCVMAREGSITPINIPQVNDVVLGRTFHVFDALDFPLGIPKSVNGSDVFVVNRCDLIVSHESQLPKLKNYFMNTVFEPMGIPEDSVILTSATKKWHLSKLSESFVHKPKSNYFTGSTGAGKTTLVHALSGISQKEGRTTWPLPFSTQRALNYKSLPKFRSKTLIDTPSLSKGTSALTYLIPSMVRKVIAGTRMVERDLKYVVPKIRAKTGQVVSIGGIIALEFPPLEHRLPVHVFAGIGGLAHTEFGHVFRDMAKLAEVNHSVETNHVKLRMHDHIGLELHRKLSFKPWRHDNNTRYAAVIENFGFLQPFLFGDFPSDYEVTVWAAPDIIVGSRPEILPYLSS